MNFIAPTDIFMLSFVKIPFNNLVDVMMGKRMQEEIPIERQIFVKNLRNARKDANLRQEDIVTKAKLSQAFISAVETLEANPSFDTCVRLSRAVGVPFQELLDPKRK